MRPILVVSAFVVVAFVAVASADLGAQAWTKVDSGSYGFQPVTDLRLLPAQPDCESPGSATYPCVRQFAFAPNATLTEWVSVRNDGPLGVALDGVRDDWLSRFDGSMLSRPVAAMDGGDPALATAAGTLEGPAFSAIVLGPGAERLIGLEFRTTGDVAFACQHWIEGSGVGWDAVPIAWHWLAFGHTEQISFDTGIEFMAPTAADCSGS
jgi:hypothetical protein